MNLTNEIMERAKVLQGECHQYVDSTFNVGKPKVTYQDATNVWVFTKIAELELKLYELSKNINHALQ